MHRYVRRGLDLDCCSLTMSKNYDYYAGRARWRPTRMIHSSPLVGTLGGCGVVGSLASCWREMTIFGQASNIFGSLIHPQFMHKLVCLSDVYGINIRSLTLSHSEY